MKALFLSYDGLTDNLGASQVIPYLTGLARAGHEITVISSEKWEKMGSNGQKIRKLLAAAKIDWHPIRYHKRPPVLSSIFDAWAMKRKAGRLHRQKNFDIVHCRSYLPSLIGLWMKRKFGVKLVFDNARLLGR